MDPIDYNGVRRVPVAVSTFLTEKITLRVASFFSCQNHGTPDGSVDLALSLNYTFMSSVGAGTKDSPY